MIGHIIRLVEGKWFGFIRYNDKDYFFHADDFQDDWQQMKMKVRLNQVVQVEFEEGVSNKGPRARNVRLIEE